DDDRRPDREDPQHRRFRREQLQARRGTEIMLFIAEVDAQVHDDVGKQQPDFGARPPVSAKGAWSEPAAFTCHEPFSSFSASHSLNFGSVMRNLLLTGELSSGTTTFSPVSTTSPPLSSSSTPGLSPVIRRCSRVTPVYPMSYGFWTTMASILPSAMAPMAIGS